MEINKAALVVLLASVFFGCTNPWMEAIRSGGVPAAPTGLSASAASSSSINLSWYSVSGATRYYIYRSSSANGTYTQCGYVTTNSATITGLSSGTTYYFRVTAYNSNGESSRSRYDYATTFGGGWFAPSRYTTLTSGSWKTGSISSFGENWYAFPVSSGTRYYVWWNDSYSGNSSYTCDIYVSAYDDNGNPIFTDADSAYSTPRSFRASKSGMVYLKVTSYLNEHGTYAIAYRTTSSRPYG